MLTPGWVDTMPAEPLLGGPDIARTADRASEPAVDDDVLRATMLTALEVLAILAAVGFVHWVFAS